MTAVRGPGEPGGVGEPGGSGDSGETGGADAATRGAADTGGAGDTVSGTKGTKRSPGGGRAGRLRAFGAEVGGFAVAGVFAYAADVGLFIWLRGSGGMDPLTAKAVSFLAGCTVAYVGNALGPYRARGANEGPRGRWRRLAVFFLVNLAGAAVQLGCLGVSHYGFGLTSARADVIAGAGVGMALGTAVRFWGIRTLVFRPVRPEPETGVHSSSVRVR